MTSIFLDDEDVAKLTGRKIKARQVDALRRMGIPFYLNAEGRAVVPKSAIEGARQSDNPINKTWVPAVLQNHGKEANK